MFGENLGPDQSPALSFPLSATLGGVSIGVTQNGVATQAFPIFVSATQVNAVSSIPDTGTSWGHSRRCPMGRSSRARPTELPDAHPRRPRPAGPPAEPGEPVSRRQFPQPTPALPSQRRALPRFQPCSRFRTALRQPVNPSAQCPGPSKHFFASWRLCERLFSLFLCAKSYAGSARAAALCQGVQS